MPYVVRIVTAAHLLFYQIQVISHGFAIQEFREIQRTKADSGIDLAPSETNIYSWTAFIRVSQPIQAEQQILVYRRIRDSNLDYILIVCRLPHVLCEHPDQCVNICSNRARVKKTNLPE